MASSILITDPDALYKSAARIEELQERADWLMQKMLEEVRSLTAIWEGSASSAYITRFNTLEDDMEKMSRKLLDNIEILRNISRHYVDAEEANRAEAEAIIKSDVLE